LAARQRGNLPGRFLS